jgi:hypothetical protein
MPPYPLKAKKSGPGRKKVKKYAQQACPSEPWLRQTTPLRGPLSVEQAVLLSLNRSLVLTDK